MLLAAQFEALSLLVLGFALVTAVLATRNLRRGSSKRQAAGNQSTAINSAELGPGAKPDAYRRWEVELHELGRQLEARLNNKIVILQHLVLEASRAADRLEQALRQAEASQAQAPPTSRDEPIDRVS